MTSPKPRSWSGSLNAAALLVLTLAALPLNAAEIRTPPDPAAPRLHGPTVFGVRPGSPFLYTVPATGEGTITFSADDLPTGIQLDAATGQITGQLNDPGTFRVKLHATSAAGHDDRLLRIVVGEKIALTPAMGWNSWNCWAGSVDQQKILQSAHAMVASGLSRHGWTYINIDDTWQGARTGPGHALQGNEKFPDLAGLTAQIHRLGLKAGIYSTPWITSYAGFPGGSSDRADGNWTDAPKGEKGWKHGRYTFEAADARQWAEWGFDYLKYDWRPNDVPHVAAMSAALRASNRDIVFSLSNTADFQHAKDWAKYANSWRTTCDIFDQWVEAEQFWQHGVSEIGFNQDRWAPFAAPGHWNDPDMLVVGYVGWGKLHPSRLTPEEQYSHISLWCMLSAPLLIGCDLEKLDPFTLNLLSNDEVLAVDQDAGGHEAKRVATSGPVDIYEKTMEDGTHVLGFFNRDSQPYTVQFNKFFWIGFEGPVHVRDLWRHKDLPDVNDPQKDLLEVHLGAHSAELYRVTSR